MGPGEGKRCTVLATAYLLSILQGHTLVQLSEHDRYRSFVDVDVVKLFENVWISFETVPRLHEVLFRLCQVPSVLKHQSD